MQRFFQLFQILRDKTGCPFVLMLIPEKKGEKSMKPKFRTFAVLGCAALCALSFTACSGGKSTELGKPANAKPLNYSERETESFTAFKGKTEDFAARFAESVYGDYEESKNFAVSPVSAFMALSLAAECAGGNTREEVLSALGVTYDELTANISTLYRSLIYDSKSTVLNLTNSIWVNEGTPVKQDCISTLSDTFYSYSYAADFLHDNKNANKAVRKFVKDQTKGVIDYDFKLNEETLFVLINTLYLKAIWNPYGRDLPMTKNKYTFTAKDGATTSKKLVQGYYHGGKVYEAEKYSAFYTQTHGGFKLKFLLPKDGYGVDDVFTAENLAEVNAIKDFGTYDEENNIKYETRCFFPEYECSYDGDLIPILQQKFGITTLFDDRCDFSTLTDAPSYCSEAKHVTNLVVDKKGIEGAAVMYIAGAGAAAPMETVYADFIIDRAFGFIITDPYDVTLFSGVVNKI